MTDGNEPIEIQRKIYREEIAKCLERLAERILVDNDSGLTDINVYAEGIYKDLLEGIFGYRLINANMNSPNTPGYDLIDKENKVAIQVSSKCDKAKIQSSINKIPDSIKPIHFQFVAIAKISLKRLRKNDFTIPTGVEFDPASDIYERPQLMLKCRSLDIERLYSLYRICRMNFGGDPEIGKLTQDHLLAFLDVFAVIYRRYESILDYCKQYLEKYDEGGKHRLSSINGMLGAQFHYALERTAQKFQKLRFDVMFNDDLWRKLSLAEDIQLELDGLSQNDENLLDVRRVYTLLNQHTQCICDIIQIFARELLMEPSSIMERFNSMVNI